MTMRLLRLTLDEERDSNVHGPLGLAKLLHLRGEGIGQLVLEQLERRLPQVLDHEEAERLGADVVRIVLELSLGQEWPDPLPAGGSSPLVRSADDHGASRSRARPAGGRDQVALGVDRRASGR